MLDKNRDTYASEMKEKTKELREQIDELANRSRDAGADVKKDARLAYHRLKDELNEIDKLMDKMMDIADDSWTNVRDDVKEMWNRVTDEFKKMKEN